METPDGAAVFELERFDWDDDGRLEVSGRWFGLRARRFVRPTLTLRGEGAGRRLLAVLDHKPWAADEGEPWTAAFEPDGDLPEIEGADLAVATDIDVRLPAPGSSGGSKRRRRRFVSGDVQADPAPAAADPARAEGAVASAAATRPEADPRRDRDRARVTELVQQRDAAVSERDAARAERRILEQELASAREALQTALRQRREREREIASGFERQLADLRERIDHERRVLNVAREDAERDRDRALRQRDKVAEERDSLVEERDHAVRERERAHVQRVGPPRSWSARPQSPLEVWTPRLIALGILVLFFLILWVLSGSA